MFILIHIQVYIIIASQIFLYDYERHTNNFRSYFYSALNRHLSYVNMTTWDRNNNSSLYFLYGNIHNNTFKVMVHKCFSLVYKYRLFLYYSARRKDVNHIVEIQYRKLFLKKQCIICNANIRNKQL